MDCKAVAEQRLLTRGLARLTSILLRILLSTKTIFHFSPIVSRSDKWKIVLVDRSIRRRILVSQFYFAIPSLIKNL